jgi:hypothetical protein
MQPSPKLSLTQRKQTLNVIWIAMTSAVLTYWAIHVIVGKQAGSGGESALVANLLAAVSVITFGSAWGWFKWSVDGVAGWATPTQAGQRSPEERAALQGRLQAAVIVCAALLEAPSVYGLVVSLTGSPYPGYFETLAILSLVGLVALRVRGVPEVFALMDRLADADPVAEP